MIAQDSTVPELLAPVADWESLAAAVHNGASAVYFGMPQFNARGRAPALGLDDVRRMIEFAHLYGVSVFVAFNILIFENELKQILPPLRELLSFGPDAIIVQDIGLAKIIRALAPQQKIHASTQMTVTCAEAISLLDELDISRFILARELSIDEVAAIRQGTQKELEVFVHGALCVSYSGQCLTSESFGGRSANRGQCAQSCRFSYDLVVDGEVRDLGVKRYLVSPHDLCGLADIPRIIEAGVDGLKIEGRLKSPEYVAQTVRNYRDRLSGILHDRSLSAAQSEMGALYSRGFFNGWLDGVNHQRLVSAEYPNHHGLEIGMVKRAGARRVAIETSYEIKPGDGLLFCDFETEFEAGSNVYKVEHDRDGLVVELANDFNSTALKSGMRVFLNSVPAIEKNLKKTFHDKAALKRIPLTFEVYGRAGEPLVLRACDPEGRKVSAKTSEPVAAARSAPLSEESARAELGALGGSCFELAQFVWNVPDAIFVHQRELKKLRQEVTGLLEAKRKTARASVINSDEEALGIIDEAARQSSAGTAELHVLLRDKTQIEAVRGLDVGTVYLDFEYGREYDSSLEELKASGVRTGLATTRILKPGENAHLKKIRRLAPETVLVRNLGALQLLRDSGLALVGDFSLNAANSVSAKWLLSKGLKRVCPSYDLNAGQLFEMLEHVNTAQIEATVHQYMPAFHMEHCVFAAFLSKGTSYKDCGRPCEKHRVELREKNGAVHPLKADAECRNTMFNGTPQAAARLIPGLLEKGVRHFRLEALFETTAELRRKIELYLAVIKGAMPADDALEGLDADERFGVSEGRLFAADTYKARKKLAAVSQSR